MKTFRIRRAWAVVATVALAIGLTPVLFAGTASAATQATVSTESQFWAAWTDTGITQIDLAASIELHSGDGNGTCSPNTYPERNSNGGSVLVDGHGFTLTQNCDKNTVLYNDGTGEALTVQNITLTHAGAPTPSVSGSGLYNDGPITLINSTITGNWTNGCNALALWLCHSSGGGVWSNSDVTVTNSTISNNRAWGLAGGIGASGAVTVTSSTVEGNRVTNGNSNFAFGGGLYAGSGATVTGSTIDSNTATCDNGCDYDFVGGGGIAVEGGIATVTGSSVTGNQAVCDSACDNVGGGILTGDTLEVSSSTVSNNGATCADDCQADGGGIYAGSGYFYDSASNQAVHATGRGTMLTITDSSLTGNQATTETGYCDCTGGAFVTDFLESATVTRSTIANNTAYWDGGASEAIAPEGGSTGIRYENSTVTGNSSGYAGAIDAWGTGVTLTLAYDTIDGNTIIQPTPSSASISSAKFSHIGEAHSSSTTPQPANLGTTTLTSFGSVVADPIGGANCVVLDSTVSQGYNFSDDASCGFTDSTDKQNAGSPQLNALAANGGPTQTMLPYTPKTNGVASPLIDAIPVAACQTGVAAGVGIDQRSVTRPQIVGCDIGAVEVTGSEYQVEAAVVIQPKFTG